MRYLLAILLTVAAQAQFIASPTIWDAAVTGATPSISENFEGTGTPTGWSGAANFDSTTDPAEGAQVMACGSTGTWDWTDQDTVRIKFYFKVSDATPASDAIMCEATINGSTSFRYTVYIRTTGVVRVYSNGNYSTATVTALSDSTWYTGWLRITHGSHVSFEFQAGLQAESAETQSGNGYTTLDSGVYDSQIGRIRFYNCTSTAWYDLSEVYY